MENGPWCELDPEDSDPRNGPLHRDPDARRYHPEEGNGRDARAPCFTAIQMLDVTIPTTDGRELHRKRHTKPEKLHQFLLKQFKLTLPDQPPPEMRSPGSPVVETF